MELCSYTLIDIRSEVVLVKIRMKSDEHFLNNELLNELITQNIIIFDQNGKRTGHGIINLDCFNANLLDG